MLIFKEGDLLSSDCAVILHQCNCFQTMGAGLAKQIATRFPRAKQADMQDSRTPQERLGGITTAFEKGKYIVNCYGQFRYGRDQCHTDYHSLRQAIKLALKQNYPMVERTTFGLAHGIGCGLAGGSWDVVLEILESLSREFSVDLYIYKYN